MLMTIDIGNTNTDLPPVCANPNTTPGLVFGGQVTPCQGGVHNI